jgi:radical SAM-linked protein
VGQLIDRGLGTELGSPRTLTLNNRPSQPSAASRRLMRAPGSAGETRGAPEGPDRDETMGSATKVRVRFAKRGDLRLVSHHDLMRCLERALRRAEIPIAETQGFNPRPKLVFALALALGIEGQREVLDLELSEAMEPAEVLRRLTMVAPAGLEFLEAEAKPPGRAARAEAVQYALPVPYDRRDSVLAAIAALIDCPSRTYLRQRPDRTVEIDLRPFVLGADLDDEGVLRLRLKMTPSGSSARPEEIVETLGLRDLLETGAVLARTDVELASL